MCLRHTPELPPTPPRPPRPSSPWPLHPCLSPRYTTHTSCTLQAHRTRRVLPVTSIVASLLADGLRLLRPHIHGCPTAWLCGLWQPHSLPAATQGAVPPVAVVAARRASHAASPHLRDRSPEEAPTAAAEVAIPRASVSPLLYQAFPHHIPPSTPLSAKPLYADTSPQAIPHTHPAHTQSTRRLTTIALAESSLLPPEPQVSLPTAFAPADHTNG